MPDDWDEQRLGLRKVVAHIDVPTLIAVVKLLEAEMLKYPSASSEALALKKFKELLEEDQAGG
jgi:hypothetical protein